MADMRWLVFVCNSACLVYSVNAAAPSVSSCVQYVPEYTALACPCTPLNCAVRVNISWDGQLPPSSVLFLPNATRENNGTQFTCRLDCGGQISTATYTLQVAYGPATDRIAIQGNSSFMTDGTRTMNLTCLATDLHPAPVYSWLDSLCSNNSQGNTCSFVPQRDDDGKTVTCLVSNTVTYQQAEKGVSLNLTYSPVTAPKMSPDSTKIVKAGDILSCSVTGGKPLVLSVNFSCDNPRHADQADTVNSTSVTSYIILDTSQANDVNMTCHCSAYWAPEPSYYTNSVIVSFRTEFPPRFISSDGPGHSRDTAVNMSENGIDIELRAYPAPNSFKFECFKDINDQTGEKNSSDYGMFIATASQRGPGSPEVTCHIRPGHNVQKGWLYMVTISNGIGSVQYYFSVTGVPPLPVTTTLSGSKADVGGIVGGVVGGIIATVVVVVVVVVVWRTYRRYEKPQPRRDQDSSPYTGLQVMQGTDQRLSAHYENSPQNAQGTSPPNIAAEPGKKPASTHYVNAQFKKPNISSSAKYVNTEAHYDLAQGPNDYVNLETKNNYEQLKPRRETQENVYKTLNTSR